MKPQVGQIWHTRKPFRWPALTPTDHIYGHHFETWYEIICCFKTDFVWSRGQKSFYICNQYTWDHDAPENDKNRFIFIHYHSEDFFKGNNLRLLTEDDKLAKMHLVFGSCERHKTEAMGHLIDHIKQKSKNTRLKKIVEVWKPFPVGQYR